MVKYRVDADGLEGTPVILPFLESQLTHGLQLEG
jgi:hypothetical protein